MGDDVSSGSCVIEYIVLHICDKTTTQVCVLDVLISKFYDVNSVDLYVSKHYR
jgi:hypothetical protein